MVPGERRDYRSIDISPDGTRALAHIGPGGGIGDGYLVDLERGNVTQITFDGMSSSPRWLPDGEHIVFVKFTPTGEAQLLKRSLFGSDSTLALVTSALPLIISGVYPDGSAIIYSEYGRVDTDVMLVRTDGRSAPRVIVDGTLSQGSAVVSRDQRWIAYTNDESGVREVCVKPTAGAGGRVQISTNGGTKPVWSPDGRELYYISGTSLMVARLAIRDGVMFADSVEPLFVVSAELGSDGSVDGVDIHPSGEKFLVQVSADDADRSHEISVRLNWASTLEAKAGAR
jgi:Tol biopolymer transport system component